LGLSSARNSDHCHQPDQHEYGRSAAQYTAVLQSLGEPDPFRFKHSAALRQIVSDAVRNGFTLGGAYSYLANRAEEHIAADHRAGDAVKVS
jgi:hypothetical protein